MRDPEVHRIESILRNPWVILGAALILGLLTILPLVAAFPLYKPLLSDPFWFPLLMMGFMLFLIINSTAICILAERKIAAFTQDRYGPNRVGFWGLLQPVADGLKFLLKEDIIPERVDKPLFILAPGLALALSLVGFAIIPWAGEVRWPWMKDGTVSTQVASLDVGVLYLLAVTSIGVYGIVLAGYASNNKYAFYGGMRASAQMISYELPLGLGLLCLLLSAGTLRPEVILHQQAATGVWYIFLHPLAFLLILISQFAEANRAPFDLAEAEQELVGGFHTEYSAMKFGLFFLAEYAHMITGSALLVALFFGGWAPLPFLSWYSAGADGAIAPTWWNVSWVAMLIKLSVFLTKVVLLVGFFMLIRWTIPRFRYDQLMRITWQGMVPAGIVLLAGLAVLALFNLQQAWWAVLGLNVLVLGGLIWTAARARRPVTGRQETLPPVDIRPLVEV
jgi:NADH-quinone oxidoreductase subunit H